MAVKPKVKVTPRMAGGKKPIASPKVAQDFKDFDLAPKGSPVMNGRKGFIGRCVDIIIQDIRDRLHSDRVEKRKEYDEFMETYFKDLVKTADGPPEKPPKNAADGLLNDLDNIIGRGKK